MGRDYGKTFQTHRLPLSSDQSIKLKNVFKVERVLKLPLLFSTVLWCVFPVCVVSQSARDFWRDDLVLIWLYFL